MWVNLRAILVTSARQSDNNPVSSWKTRMVIFLKIRICGQSRDEDKRKNKVFKNWELKPNRSSYLNVADLWVVVSRPDFCDNRQRLEIAGQTQAATGS